MSFRKRNLALSGPSSSYQKTEPEAFTNPIPGVRPSPLDGRLTTSVGASSLDDLLGHSGLALGNSLLIEENGTTEFSTTLLRYFAAEGVVQGHKVHIVGVGEPWARDLPGVSGTVGEDTARLGSRTGPGKERMKIAWRYERLGDFGAGLASARAPPALLRNPTVDASSNTNQAAPTAFCHAFDLTKRLRVTDPSLFNFIPVRQASQLESPFQPILQSLKDHLTAAPKSVLHRLLIPNLLSPAIYPPDSITPKHILQFLHALRALLRQYSTQFVVMLTLPLMLHPRSTGLVRWMELLSDGVMELSPFPHSDQDAPPTTSGAATAQEEKPQGLVKVHRLPVFSEKGGGGLLGDDLAFTVSRRKFVIKPFNLPPVEGDTEAQRGDGEGKPAKVDIEF
ncbi:MAG: hypothetical protein LQ341_001013 [Variospora aurantia]|nr:MAG: hypothetical protein LQ341_001013 [Variospora aurantia]